jgi:hypothetical protein
MCFGKPFTYVPSVKISDAFVIDRGYSASRGFGPRPTRNICEHIQPSDRCTARNAFERFSKLREGLSDDQLASAVPEQQPQFKVAEDGQRYRLWAFDQYKSHGTEK